MYINTKPKQVVLNQRHLLPQETCGKFWKFFYCPNWVEGDAIASGEYRPARDPANHPVINNHHAPPTHRRIIFSKTSIVLRLRNSHLHY